MSPRPQFIANDAVMSLKEKKKLKIYQFCGLQSLFLPPEWATTSKEDASDFDSSHDYSFSKSVYASWDGLIVFVCLILALYFVVL